MYSQARAVTALVSKGLPVTASLFRQTRFKLLHGLGFVRSEQRADLRPKSVALLRTFIFPVIIPVYYSR